MPSLSPQLILFLDPSGQPHAEAPSVNGARTKIDLDPDFAERNPEIMSALCAQLTALRLAAERELVETRKRNIAYYAQTYPKCDITRVWPKAEAQFAKRVARHYSGELGNASGTRKETPDPVDLTDLI